MRKAEVYFNIDDISSAENTEINHYIKQALRANALFTVDKDYVVQDGQVIIVDDFTGRLMIGRRYSDGLHPKHLKQRKALRLKTRTERVQR